MRVVFVVAVTLGLLLSSVPVRVRADSDGAPNSALRLVSENEPQTPPKQRQDTPPKSAAQGSKLKLKELPLALNLNSSEIVKRNDLDSLIVKPWTPGRGAVGVKVEVTW